MDEHRIHCGLCKVFVDDWRDHEQSEEHQNKIHNLGGIEAILERRMIVDKICINNPSMAKMAEQLNESVAIKMENILTGKKGYNINQSDDLEKKDGFITPDGDWYSCDPVYHDAFAEEFLERFEEHLRENNQKRLLNTYKRHRKKYNDAKTYLIDHSGWFSVTVGLTDVYMVESKETGTTPQQKKTLKRWFLKYQHPFHLNGELINDEFHDFFVTA